MASGRLHELSLKTQAQLRSYVQIRSMTDVVLGLLMNAIDAAASKVTIRIDLRKGFCDVLDDGAGIFKEEFLDTGGLGRPFCKDEIAICCTDGDTSREHESDKYGRYGQFLAALAGVSLLLIASKGSAGTTNSVIFRNGRRVTTVLDTTHEELLSIQHGSSIAVHDLFGNMPVRVKDRATRLGNQSQLEREFAALKYDVAALLLASTRQLSIDLVEVNTLRRVRYDSPHRPASSALCNVLSTLQQFKYTHSPALDWTVVSGQLHNINVTGFFGLEPAANKDIQFLSIDTRPLSRSHDIFKVINDAFMASSFGLGVDQAEQAGDRSQEANIYSGSRLYGLNQSSGRWPRFVIRIDSSRLDCELIENGSAHAESATILQLIFALVNSLICEFLKSYGFKIRRDDPTVHSEHPARCATTKIDCVANQQPRTMSSYNSRPHSQDGAQPMSRGIPDEDPAGSGDLIKTRSDEMAPNEQVIYWTDPQTGQNLMLNARTGMRLPNINSVAAREGSRRKLRDSRNVAQVAAQAAKCKHFGTNLERPICSTDTAATLNNRRRADRDASGSVYAHITKADLRDASVLGQADDKFILLSTHGAGGQALLLLDQHAADERVQVERLFSQMCDEAGQKLANAIILEVTRSEAEQLQATQAYFASWSIEYSVVLRDNAPQVYVTALPGLIAERCRLQPSLLAGILQRDLSSAKLVPRSPVDRDWLSGIAHCPPGVVAMLISRACRSAIMFNDKLCHEQCQTLVHNLSQCQFPFQCAHGRPSMTVIANLGSGVHAEQYVDFGQGWRGWTA